MWNDWYITDYKGYVGYASAKYVDIKKKKVFLAESALALLIYKCYNNSADVIYFIKIIRNISFIETTVS
jgi:uncharacterized protein YgiM (DUF1202 family)